MFIRKRDPRYKTHLANQAAANEAKSQIRETKKSKKSTISVATFVPQDWQNVEGPHENEDWTIMEDEREVLECVACRKIFKSEAAWKSHERSRKHIREIERLRDEMLADNDELGLTLDGDGEQCDSDGPDESYSNQDEESHTIMNQDVGDEESDGKENHEEDIGAENTSAPHAMVESDGIDDLDKMTLADKEGVEIEEHCKKPEAAEKISKKDKRRAKEATKKAQENVGQLVSILGNKI